MNMNFKSGARYPNNIKMLRLMAGYKSQKEFAKACGLSVPTIVNLESGRLAPHQVTVSKILNRLAVLNVRYEDLWDKNLFLREIKTNHTDDFTG